MKIGDKFKFEEIEDVFENTTWAIIKEYQSVDKHKYFLIEPNSNKYNKMIINEDKSVIVTDVFDNIYENEILNKLQKELFEDEHPCGDCIYFREECMKQMKECDYSVKDRFLIR